MRFLLIQICPEFPDDGETAWYWDTERPLKKGVKGDNPYIAVQVERSKDPNNYRRVEGLQLLFTDQAEYYAVCPSCYRTFSRMQWSGCTRANAWHSHSQHYLEFHQKWRGWCEFCDPVFGNGGWIP